MGKKEVIIETVQKAIKNIIKEGLMGATIEDTVRKIDIIIEKLRNCGIRVEYEVDVKDALTSEKDCMKKIGEVYHEGQVYKIYYAAEVDPRTRIPIIIYYGIKIEEIPDNVDASCVMRALSK